MIIPCGANIWRSGPNSLPTSPTGSEVTPAKTKRGLCGRRRAAEPNLAIIGEIAVWRAANGIHPNDPRPTGAAQLPTAPALWQHHLDRSLARGSDDNIGRLDIPERQSAGTSRDRRHEDRQRLPQPPAIRPNSPPRAGLIEAALA